MYKYNTESLNHSIGALSDEKGSIDVEWVAHEQVFCVRSTDGTKIPPKSDKPTLDTLIKPQLLLKSLRLLVIGALLSYIDIEY